MPFNAQEQAATLTNYLREVVDNTMRNRPFWYEMQRLSRIQYNVGGQNIEWRVEMDINQGTPHDDTMTPTFSTVERYQIARTNYRGYFMGERLGRQTLQKNKGPEAIINLMKDATTKAKNNFQQSIQEDVFIDGTLAANALKWEGFETFLTAHASATGAAGKTRDPDGEYAGLITDPGNYGGSWTGDWPDGTSRTPSFDFWSPLLINTSATTGVAATEPWGAAPVSFANYGVDQLAWGIQYAMRQPTAEPIQPLDLILFNTNDLYAFTRLFRGTERIIVEQDPGSGKAVGFKLWNFDGARLGADFGVPASTIYGLMFSHIEYYSPAPEMFEVEPPQWLQDGSGMIFPAYNHGNFKYNPRGFVKWYPYT